MKSTQMRRRRRRTTWIWKPRASRAGILVLLASTSTEAKFPDRGGLSYPSFGYLEFVLERYDILRSRVFGTSTIKGTSMREKSEEAREKAGEGKYKGKMAMLISLSIPNCRPRGQKRQRK